MLALLANRGIEIVVSILAIPLLVRTLGKEAFGTVAVGAAFAAYFSGLTAYGFQMTGTRDVARARANHAELAERARVIMGTSLLLAAVGTGIAVLTVFFVPILRKSAALMILSVLYVQFQALSPVWFFQAVEDARQVLVASLLSRAIYLVLLVLVVRGPDDALLVPMAGAVAAGAALLWSYRTARVKYGVTIDKLSVAAALATVRSGASAAAAQFSPVLFNATTTLILGYTAHPAVVGSWSVAVRVAETLSSAVQVAVGALTAPVVRGSISLRRAALSAATVGGALSLGALVLAGPISAVLVGGEGASEVALAIRMLSLWPFAIAMRNHFGVNQLIVQGGDADFRNIVLLSSMAGCAASVLLVPGLGLAAAASVIVGTISLMAVWCARASAKLRSQEP